MVVRRTPGKKIKLIHEVSKDVIELTVVSIQSRTSVEIRFDYEWDNFQVMDDTYEMHGDVLLVKNCELDVLHKSGDKMEIQVVDISHKDTNIRLVDKDRLFRFEWSDRFLTV